MRTLRRAVPSMNGLFTFEAAARCRSFSKAADELNVTPAAVSRMVGRLEDHLGATLFERRPGGLALTPDGELLFNALARSFAGIDTALGEIEDRRTGSQTVALSVSTGFTTHWLMPRMPAFKSEFPNVDLRLQLVMGALAGPVGDVDLGMRFIRRLDERHEGTLLMPEILLPICSPAFLGGADLALPDWPAAVAGGGPPDWSSFFFRTGTGEGAALNAMVFSDYAIVVQAALLGQGVALGWLNVAAHWLRTGALVPADPRLLVTDRRLYLLRLRDRPQRPVVSQVRDWLVSELEADVLAVAARFSELDLAAHLTPRTG